MKWKHPHLWILALCITCLSCATAPVQDIKPGEKPALESDEAGLWMAMDEIEGNLKTSGRVEHDPDLNAYVKKIICNLQPDYCDDIRYVIVQTPHFNASMAPNGFMQIWTGLMLRAQNEAQLAYVLGHEMGHYQRRHSLKQWRTVRDTSSALIFLQVVAAGAGVGYAGSIAQMAAMAGIFAYSRDMEREADDIGFELMANAGYDFHEAAKIWQALIEERDAADQPDQFILFASHPTTSERVHTMQKMADQLESRGRTGAPYQKEYVDAVRPFRGRWLKNELRKRDFAASQVVLKHLLNAGDNPGELYYYQGELYRMRAQEGDLENAISSYQKALSYEQYPPAVLRSLGLLFWKARKFEDARDSFNNYLVVDPDAPDYEMIKSYLEELQ
jgi:predicted Zn-dependent protease